jgi:glucosamine-6-phosphate deaminase
VFADERTLARELAAILAQALTADRSLVLGLPTGRTPVLLYRELVTLAKAGQVDFSRATTFNLDEFLVPGSTDPAPYRQFMESHLFRYVNLDPRRTNLLNGAAVDIDAECARYEAAIVAAGGIGLQILGIGANGHIGFNEPGPELAARTHRVVLRPETRRANASLFGGDVAKVPAEALSMGMATILQARSIRLVATGRSKAECVRQMIEGPLTTMLPASFLQVHRDVVVMLDEAAASSLVRREVCHPRVRR